MEQEINILDELNKGACMGKDAISFIINKVQDENLKKELEIQSGKYGDILNKIAELYPKYSNDTPHETNVMNKVMTWYGIEMKTMMDDSTSKIAELLMQGTNMGIIEGRKLLNHKDCDEQTKSIIEEYVDMQEEAIEALKKYL